MSKPTAYALGVVLFFGALYSSTLPNAHCLDCYDRVRALMNPSLPELLNPHHLLSHTAMLFWDRLFRLAGYSGNFFFPAQTLNILLGISGLSLFYGFLVLVTKNPLLSFLSSLNLGVSYGYWFNATQVENYGLNNSLLLTAVFILGHYLKNPGRLKAFAFGSVLGLSGLMHQFSYLFFPVPLVVIRLHGRLQRKFKRISALLFIFGFGFFGFVPYLMVSYFVLHHRSLQELASWMTLYAHTLPGFGSLRESYLSVFGLFEAFFGTYLEDIFRSGANLSWILWFLLFLPPLLFLEFFRRTVFRFSGRLLSGGTYEAGSIISCLGLLIYWGFSAYWDPKSYEVWQVGLPFFWAFCTLLLASDAEGRKDFKNPLLLMGVFVLLFLTNLFGTVLPDKRLNEDWQYQASKGVAQISRPGDFLFIPSGLMEQYLSFSLQRPNVRTLHNIALKNRTDKTKIFEEIKDLMEKALREGNHVYVTEEFVEPSDGILELNRLDRNELRKFWEPYYPKFIHVGSYRGLSMHRTFGMRRGFREYRIFELKNI